MAAFVAFPAKNWPFHALKWGFPPRFRRSEWAWMALAAGVVGYNVSAAGDGEMLSEQADRWIAKHPVSVRLMIAVVAAHVANLSPSRLDPIHLFFTTVRRLYENNRSRQ